MTTRVTVMLDDENVRQIRYEQIRLIKETQMSVSFSKVANMYVAKGILCKK